MEDLIYQYFEGNITPKDKAELFSRLEKDAELKKEFISIQNLYALSSSLSLQTDTNQAYRELKKFKRKRNTHVLKKSFRNISLYAAVILFTGFTTWFAFDTFYANIQPAGYQEYITPAGQRAMVKLQDGTTVWLNACSSLRYPGSFSSSERRVHLDGEAFFEVTPNPGQPFIVSTSKLDIKVLGTKFNVYAYSTQEEFLTSVTEGSVEIYPPHIPSHAMNLTAFQCATLRNNTLIRSNFTSTEFLLWKEGIYTFDDMAFEEIIKKLQIYFDITIDIRNDQLKKYKFSGKFRQRDGVESILRTLQKIYRFSFTRDDEKNLITIV